MKALQEIQSALSVPKSQKNTFGNYNYRSCEDILTALKPLLAKRNCTLTLTDEMVMLGDRFYVKATAILSDGKTSVDVHGYAREALTKKGMDESQITGAASSYARKYALNGMFAIDDTKDADATNTHGKDAQPKKTPPKQQPPKKTVTTITPDQAILIKDLCAELEFGEEQITKMLAWNKLSYQPKNTSMIAKQDYELIIGFLEGKMKEKQGGADGN